MNKFDMYIIILFLLKIIFVILAFSHLYFKIKHKTGSETDKQILFWKEKIEFIFIILMSCLLIYLFNPRNDRIFMINQETKILLFLFGFILLITANWSTFFKESGVFKKIKYIAGG